MNLEKFYRPVTRADIKTKMLTMLSVLAASGLLRRGNYRILLQIGLAVGVALAADYLGSRFYPRRPSFSRSAAISGSIIALLLRPDSPLLIVGGAALIAIGSKYLLKLSGNHVFNPAGFGLFAVSLAPGQSLAWWGASSTWLVVALGCWVAYSFRRFRLVLSYLVPLGLMLATRGYLRGWPPLSSVYMLNFFFAFVMLVEPRTSPRRRSARVVFGLLVGLFNFVYLVFLPQHEPSILALLTGNLLVPVIAKATKQAGGWSLKFW